MNNYVPFCMCILVTLTRCCKLVSFLYISSRKSPNTVARCRVFSVQLCTDCAVVKKICAVVNRNLCSCKNAVFLCQKTKQEPFQMLTILCHLAGQSQCHTQPVRHRYNVGFKHSILKTLSVLSTLRLGKVPIQSHDAGFLVCSCAQIVQL